MLAGSALLFALVIGLLLMTLLRPGFGRGLEPMKWIVHGGLVMPSVVLTLLVAYALFMGERLIAKPVETPPHRIAAHADQWNWTFTYPDLDGAAATVNRMHMPVGEPVDIVLTSEDVIHSYWVPRLGGKLDAIPGHENVIRLTADRPGTYRGVCAEFCGTGHTAMTFTVEAHAAEDYLALGAMAGDEGQGVDPDAEGDDDE
jgi:cytochrome c oxidase subunit II